MYVPLSGVVKACIQHTLCFQNGFARSFLTTCNWMVCWGMLCFLCGGAVWVVLCACAVCFMWCQPFLSYDMVNVRGCNSFQEGKQQWLLRNGMEGQKKRVAKAQVRCVWISYMLSSSLTLSELCWSDPSFSLLRHIYFTVYYIRWLTRRGKVLAFMLSTWSQCRHHFIFAFHILKSCNKGVSRLHRLFFISSLSSLSFLFGIFLVSYLSVASFRLSLSHVTTVPLTFCENQDSLMIFLVNYVSLGGAQSVLLRNPHAFYKQGKTSATLEVTVCAKKNMFSLFNSRYHVHTSIHTYIDIHTYVYIHT